MVVSIGSPPSGRYVTAIACMVAPLTSGLPVAVMVWITPGASMPDVASLLSFADIAAIAAMSWPPMPGMSAPPKPPAGAPACCCIAVACAIASAALCLACLALSKSPIGHCLLLGGTKLERYALPAQASTTL